MSNPTAQPNLGGRPRNPSIDAKALVELRRAAGYSRRSLVNALKGTGCKISLSSLIKWERGLRGPSAETLAHIARVLGVAARDLAREPDRAA